MVGRQVITGRNRIIVGVLVAVSIGLAAAIPLVISYLRAEEVRVAVATYDTALVKALENLEPEFLGDTVTERERSRVTSYMTSLWGRGVYVEGRLLDMDIGRIESAEPTVTAYVTEKWRYVERDRTNRKQIGDPVFETNKLTYTLLRVNGRLVVHLSEFTEPAKSDGEATR